MLCTDTDLLRWEPRLAIDARFAAQTLFEGRGRLTGRKLAFAADAAACDGAIVVIDDACFTASNASAPAFLTIGPAALGIAAVMPGDGPVAFAVRTFAAQRELVGSIVARTCGFDAGRGAGADAVALRGPCTLGTLHLIYASLAAATLDEDADWHVRAELYGRLFRKAMRAACAMADEEGGSRAEVFANQEVA